jgi:hypothetical protein
MGALPLAAVIGAKALYLLFIWLLSAIVASWLSNRKGYGERWGLGTGLLLTIAGVVVWLLVPAREGSRWNPRGGFLPARQPRSSAPQS